MKTRTVWVLVDQGGQWFEEERVVTCSKYGWQVHVQRGGGWDLTDGFTHPEITGGAVGMGA